MDDILKPPVPPQLPYELADYLWLAEDWEESTHSLPSTNGNLPMIGSENLYLGELNGYPAIVCAPSETSATITSASVGWIPRPLTFYYTVYVVNTTGFNGDHSAIYGGTGGTWAQLLTNSDRTTMKLAQETYSTMEGYWIVVACSTASDGNTILKLHTQSLKTKTLGSQYFEDIRIDVADTDDIRTFINTLAIFREAHDEETLISNMDDLAQRVGYPSGTIT